MFRSFTHNKKKNDEWRCWPLYTTAVWLLPRLGVAAVPSSLPSTTTTTTFKYARRRVFGKDRTEK